MTRTGVNTALIRRKNPKKEEEPPQLEEHEFPAEIQAKLAALQELRLELDEIVARVEASAKLDRRVLDGLKNVRKSPNDELSDLATRSLEIFLRDTPAVKAKSKLRNAVKMVTAMQETVS